MQDQQISQFILGVDCLDCLKPPHYLPSTRNRTVVWAVDGPGVPVSPGRAIRLHPYPPSHCRRQ